MLSDSKYFVKFFKGDKAELSPLLSLPFFFFSLYLYFADARNLLGNLGMDMTLLVKQVRSKVSLYADLIFFL